MNDSEAEQLETFWKRLLQAPKNTGDYEELLKQYRYKIHAMKSSAAMIGAVAVSGLARLLEYGARDGKITLLNQLTEEFLSEWKLLKQELSPLAVTDDNQEDKPAGDASLLLEYLRLLEQAMEEMDVDTADEIIRQFLRYHYPDDQWEVMKNLEDGVTNLDGEKVKKECNKMRELLQA
jgi:chemotaxis protein histidine kinase CheA